MLTFEEALKASLQGLDQGFRAAEGDLREAVAAASEGVARLTNQRARLELRKFDERPSGTYYELRMVFGNRYYEVAAFHISAQGYPIRAGRSLQLLTEGEYEADIASAPELSNYFIAMASNPDSPLVLRIALFLRQGEAGGTVGG